MGKRVLWAGLDTGEETSRLSVIGEDLVPVFEETLLSRLRHVLESKNKVLTAIYNLPPLLLHETYLRYLAYGRQLADYVAAGFAETASGEVALTCTPKWEASNFRTHNYDPWAAFRESRCPIRILRAAEASTFRLEGHEAELAADGRITVETVPGTTHFLPMERPDLVRETLKACVAL